MQCKSSSKLTPIKFKISYTVICKTFPLVSQASLLSIWSTERHWTDTGLCIGQQLMPQQGMHTACRSFANECCCSKGGLGQCAGLRVGLCLWLSELCVHGAACQGCGWWWKLVKFHYPGVSSEDRAPFSNSSTQEGPFPLNGLPRS